MELEVTSEGHGEGCGRGGARGQSRRPRTERREEAEEGMRAKESERRSGELRGIVRKHPGEQAERRWRSEGAHAASTRSSSYWRKVEDNLAPGGLGWLCLAELLQEWAGWGAR